MTIPSTVTQISETAFNDCSGLKVVFNGTESDWEFNFKYSFPEDTVVECLVEDTSEEIIEAIIIED